MQRKDITTTNAKKAAKESELAAVVFCRDKYRYWARAGLPEDQDYYALEIKAETCALCYRHPGCFNCPLSRKKADFFNCCREWRKMNDAAYKGRDRAFRHACSVLADRLAEIAKRLRKAQ